MADKILEVFREKNRFNVLELAFKLQADRKRVKEALDTLVSLGRLRVELKQRHEDSAPMRRVLGCRCSIRGSYGETYILTD